MKLWHWLLIGGGGILLLTRSAKAAPPADNAACRKCKDDCYTNAAEMIKDPTYKFDLVACQKSCDDNYGVCPNV